MLQSLRNKLGSKEEGFTLIELMVVVLIIAILIAIAIPTFLGARNRAFDKQAQSNLRNALVTNDEFYTDNQSYSADNTAGGELDALEPQLAWGTLAADDSGVVATQPAGVTAGVAADQITILQSDSASATVFCLAKIATGANAGTYYDKLASGATCGTDPTAAGTYQSTSDGWK